jgi:endonuclease-8
MPEGDTVWRAAHHLREVLAGRELTRSDFRVPAHATLDLSGREVDEVLSRGKHLLIRVGDASIHSHLKMEGSWHVHRLGTRWRRPAHQARAVLETREHQAVGYSLGVLEVLKR